jgi:transcriptional regulator, MarR family
MYIQSEVLHMLTKEELPDCPVATTVQLIGNKWKLLILRNLLARPWRFNEMLRSIPGISQKVLTDNLRALETDGMLIDDRSCCIAGGLLQTICKSLES